jgi:cell division protease FtsH
MNDSSPNSDRSGGGPDRPGSQPPQPPTRFNRNVFSWLLIIGVAILIAVVISQAQNKAAEKKWGEFVAIITTKDVLDTEKGIVIHDDRAVAHINTDAPGAPSDSRIAFTFSQQTKDEWIEKLQAIEHVVPYISEAPSSGLLQGLLYFLPWLLVLGVIWFILFRAVRGGGGGMGMLGSFGRSRHKVVNKEMTNITLEDVAGVEEAKEEVQEIIEFLKHPKKFQRLGGRIPRGVLLVGLPGCGKTLLAKAVAGEAEVPFFSISGSDFVEMFVGVGASRVRDLFKQAKDNSPCIIFLDEIDAVGRRRGAGFASGGHDEREQTLNAILVEMDGFETNDQVIVMSATNRADVLDPALTRPGRFDRQINVPLPDIKGRLEILRVHARRVKMSPSIDLEKLARQTPMFSGADLAAIINESAIIATLANKDFVEMSDLEEARDKVKFGRAHKSRRIEEEERVGTAYHEAGHAVINMLLPEADPLHKVTIIPRGQAMGATFSLPEKDRYGYGQRFVASELRRLCGGRIAEKKKTGDVTSGAAMDIRMATQYARHMVLEWGMSERLGFVDYSADDTGNPLVQERAYSDQTAKIVDEEVKKLIDEAYADAQQMIEENWQKVTGVAEALLKYETLNAEDVEKIMSGQALDKPSVSELLEAESKKTAAPERRNAVSPPADDEPTGDAPLPSPA